MADIFDFSGKSSSAAVRLFALNISDAHYLRGIRIKSPRKKSL